MEQRLSSPRQPLAQRLAFGGLFLALGILFPLLFHLLPAGSGEIFLPMHIPVILAGMVLGPALGAAVGALTPLLNTPVGSMPPPARLPFMMAELAVFALVSGLFSNKIAKNALFAFPAVIAAEISGRGFFLLSVAALQGVTPLKTAVIWQQIQTGFVGLAVQAVLVPLMVIAIKKIMDKEAK